MCWENVLVSDTLPRCRTQRGHLSAGVARDQVAHLSNCGVPVAHGGPTALLCRSAADLSALTGLTALHLTRMAHLSGSAIAVLLAKLPAAASLRLVNLDNTVRAAG